MTRGLDAAHAQTFGEVRAELTRWLLNEAMPVWSTVGCDRASGGFHEKLDDHYTPSVEPRRARLVARQFDVFSSVAPLGWDGPADSLVQHGLAFLRAHHLREDGGVWPSVQDGAVVARGPDLYEASFVLFALAAASRYSGDAEAIDLRTCAFLRAHHRDPRAGFQDAVASQLRANPHMHMLEACLAWIAAGSSHPVWGEVADEIADLAMTAMIDPATGALGECFGADWRPVRDALGALVEPGHQFEWAWLLNRWSDARGRPDARIFAARLMDVGEGSGVNADGFAINELHGDLAPRDAASRLWPQTERIKAWCDRAGRAAPGAGRADALHAAVCGGQALMAYFRAAPRGLWRETRDPDGQFRPDLCRASSLYHIVGAIHAMHEVDCDFTRGAD
jgi:mannose-6-phosphate isomerase